MQPEERVMLAALRQQGLGLRSITEVLGRDASSLSRKLRRGAGSDGIYLSKQAQFAAETRRRAVQPMLKLGPSSPLWPLVAHLLGWLWSPQQIAQTHAAHVA